MYIRRIQTSENSSYNDEIICIQIQIQIQKGLLKHIHIYSNHTQYDNTKIITNIKYPL